MEGILSGAYGGLEDVTRMSQTIALGVLAADFSLVGIHGFKFAAQASIGISKARSYRVKLTQNNLNVKLTLPAPTTAEHPGSTVYEVRDLET